MPRFGRIRVCILTVQSEHILQALFSCSPSDTIIFKTWNDDNIYRSLSKRFVDMYKTLPYPVWGVGEGYGANYLVKLLSSRYVGLDQFERSAVWMKRMKRDFMELSLAVIRLFFQFEKFIGYSSINKGEKVCVKVFMMRLKTAKCT